MPKAINLRELEDIEDIQRYCTQEGIRNFNLMRKYERSDEYEYYKGLATAFFWVVSMIEKGVIPEKETE